MAESDRLFEGIEIAIAGRLASMSRMEAIVRIREAGGRYARAPGPATTLLVVGQAQWPLASNGTPSRSLRLAGRLREGGQPIRIVSELDFLESLGLKRQLEDLNRLYTTVQVARLLELPASRIRSWTRRGLIRPAKVEKRLSWFDFKEVRSAQALRRLVEAGVPLARIRKSLRQIASWLPDARGLLVQLESLEPAEMLSIRLDGGKVAAPNGQMLLNFRGEQPARPTPFSVFSPAAIKIKDRQREAEVWFEVGLEAEDQGRLEDAVAAYGKSLEAGGPQPETLFNLGNVHYQAGRFVESAASFLKALELDPEYVECWNNLGNALSQLGKTSEAVKTYQRALQIEPRYPEANSNLADALQQLGRTEEARRHYDAYFQEDPHSPWAMEIRRRLGILPHRVK
jgi:Flp pilus assembly protein TadD/DNA-binding transcriptional MerR regulator